MDNKVVVANWKMNHVDVENFFNKFDNHNVKTVICPNFCDIENTFKSINKCKILLGAQNVSEFREGAYTGEINAEMLSHTKALYCIVGHSERREHFAETQESIYKKIMNLLAYNIVPILCIGEKTFLNTEASLKEIDNQLIMLKGFDDRLVIAYEPIYSIGTGLVPTNEHINAVLKHIKKNTCAYKVLYGGSVNEKNIESLMKISECQGFLIGGASMNPEALSHICEICNMEK